MISLILIALAATDPAPVTFDDAVANALSKHPAMRIATEDAARALAQLEQARAPSLPSLNVNANYTRLESDRGLQQADGSFRILQNANQFAGNVQLGLPLLNTPRWAQWYRASKNADGVAATAADVKRQVAVAAARAWLTVLAQKRVVLAATTARDTAQKHLSFASDRLKGGVGTRIDEVRAAQEYSVSNQQLENALAALIRAQEALGVATGSDVPLDVVASEPELNAPPSLEQSIDAVESARLDVRAAKIRSETAVDATRVDWMDYVPLLNVVFQPVTSAPSTPTSPVLGWQMNVVMQLPLYEGGLRYGQSHERQANAKSAVAQLESSVRQAKSEVRVAFQAVTHADEALRSARDAAKQATDALDLANELWRAGSTTNLEVIDAERRARDAELAKALAEDAARQARLDLLVASGSFPR
ncbi:MAG: TolC family protein [Archangium sp.]|nr:TolC family protein [Archangium sp.]